MTQTYKTKAEQFIRVDFDYLDSNTTAAIGPMAEAIYFRIIRKAWRANGKKGQIMTATINQAHVATDMGVSRKTVNDHIKVLEKIGWVKKVGDPRKAQYEIGYWPNDYFAHQYTSDLVNEMETYALENDLTIKKGPKKGEPSITRISSAMRKEMAQRFYGISKGKLPKSQLEQNLHKGSEGEILDNILPQAENPGLENTQSTVTNIVHKNKRTLGNREEDLNREEFGSLATPEISSTERSEVEPSFLESHREIQNTDQSVKSDFARSTHRVNDPTPTPNPPRSRFKDSEPAKASLKALMDAAKRKADETTTKQYNRTKAREAKALNFDGKGENSSGMRVLEGVWTKEFKKNYPDVPLAKWAGKERGITKQLITKYSGTIVRNLFEYALSNWDTMNAGFKIKKPDSPTLGWLLKFHDSFVPMAEKWTKVHAVWKEYNDWWDANPNAVSPPADLKARYKACAKEIESLGLLRQP